MAVLLVALDHAGVRFLQGGYVGVDVFFVLSGYLITGVLVSSADKERGRDYFFKFYSRRARRILPAATLTLAVTDLAASHLINLERAHEVLVASISAAFFVVNFHFAAIGTNYFAQGQPPSALQHYWSLSVEEQFYLVWPLLVAIVLLGVTLKGRRRAERARTYAGTHRGLEALAVSVTVLSLAYAVYDTHHSAITAYFSSLARAWELGLGALLWLNMGRVSRLRRASRAILGWLGLAAVVLASTAYSAATPFPGLAALLPTLGAAGIIAAGASGEHVRFAPSRVLSLGPFQYIGDRSYTFYLWHWPVLILAMEHVGHGLSLTTNLLLLAGAFLLSIFTYAIFENPIRNATKLRGSAGLVLWPAAIWTVLFVSSIHWSDYQNAVNSVYTPASTAEVFKAEPEALLAASTGSAHGSWRPPSPAAVVQAVAAVRKSLPLPSPLIPSPLALPAAAYYVPSNCIAFPGQTRSSICSFGAMSSRKTLVVFGDSHAQMWLPAILSFGRQKGYDVRPIMKLQCTPAVWGGIEQEGQCASWYRWGIAQIRALHPALVIVVGHYNFAPAENQVEYNSPHSIHNIANFGAAVRSYAWQKIVLGDAPGQEQGTYRLPPGAKGDHGTWLLTEYLGKSKTLRGVESATKAFGVFLDTTPWFCYEGICPMVVGHTIVNFNRNHITRGLCGRSRPAFHKCTHATAHGRRHHGQVREPLIPFGLNASRWLPA